jgi:cytochrome c-type biogenesis protein CcmH
MRKEGVNRMKTLMRMVIVLLTVGVMVAVLASAPPVKAQNPVSDDEVNAVAKQLYCPVCENTPLDVCPTQACKDWREMIRQQLSQGWSEAQVKDYFVASYGPRVLARPPASGFSTLVWVLPVLGLAGGGLFLWQMVRRWQRRPLLAGSDMSGAAEQPADLPPELLARIEREVESRY